MSDTGSFGYGQQKPQDYADWSNVIDFIVRQRIAQINTVKVVQVIAVHPGAGSPPVAGTVDVLPLVNQIDGNGYAVQHQTVFGIPYYRFTVGPWSIIADPAVNDLGLMLCCDRDSSSVVRGGKQTTPASRRKYSMSDGFYLPSGLPSQAVTSAYLQLKPDGTLVILDQQGNRLTTGANGWSMTGNLTVAGTITGSDFSADGLISYKNHTHSGVTTGGGTSGPPTPGS